MDNDIKIIKDINNKNIKVIFACYEEINYHMEEYNGAIKKK